VSYKYVEFDALQGEVIVSVEGLHVGSEEIVFITASRKMFTLFHDQVCCESVAVADLEGDEQCLIGQTVLLAEERSDDSFEEKYFSDNSCPDSYTWTFYTIATIKGYVDIRWLGQSTGNYSESVDFKMLQL